MVTRPSGDRAHAAQDLARRARRSQRPDGLVDRRVAGDRARTSCRPRSASPGRRASVAATSSRGISPALEVRADLHEPRARVVGEPAGADDGVARAPLSSGARRPPPSPRSTGASCLRPLVGAVATLIALTDHVAVDPASYCAASISFDRRRRSPPSACAPVPLPGPAPAANTTGVGALAALASRSSSASMSHTTGSRAELASRSAAWSGIANQRRVRDGRRRRAAASSLIPILPCPPATTRPCDGSYARDGPPHGPATAERLQQVEPHLAARGERRHRVGQPVERHLAHDGDRRGLKPLRHLRAGEGRAHHQAAVVVDHEP